MSLRLRLLNLEARIKPERTCSVVRAPAFVFGLDKEDLATWFADNHPGKCNVLLVGQPLEPEAWQALAQHCTTRGF